MGQAGIDKLFGGAGDDHFDGGAGAHLIVGDSGNDSAAADPLDELTGVEVVA